MNVAAAIAPTVHVAAYGDLLLAFTLAGLIGLEREMSQHAAGMRTHTLVGLGSALIMLVSKFGFSDIISNNVILDPSRVAAQIVSGIGFIGGGLIFVRRDAVRGLTTAATIWVAAGVGMACGAGLPLLALATTAGHFVVVTAFPPLTRALHWVRGLPGQVRVHYRDGEGVLRHVLTETTARGFGVAEVATEPVRSTELVHIGNGRPDQRVVALMMRVTGRASLPDLAAALSEMDGVLSVDAGDMDDEE